MLLDNISTLTGHSVRVDFVVFEKMYDVQYGIADAWREELLRGLHVVRVEMFGLVIVAYEMNIYRRVP